MSTTADTYVRARIDTNTKERAASAKTGNETDADPNACDSLPSD